MWAVAVLLAPALAERGEARYSVEVIAERTGLTPARVHDSLRFLLRRRCIRPVAADGGAPVYAVDRS